MASNNDKSINYLCKYQVPTMIFMMDDERIEMEPSNILSIEKVDDLEFNLRSVIKVTLRIDVRKKLWIIKNKQNIVCKFELLKIGADIENEEFVTNPETVWNEEFSIFFNDYDDTMDISSFEKRISMNDDSENGSSEIHDENYYESQNDLEVYLFNKKLLNASTKTVNEVFTEDTMQQMIARVCTASGHNKVLMSPVENDEVYQELILPANSGYKSIMYLDQYYGLYKRGALIYYDPDCLYVINPNGKCTAKRSKEYGHTTIIATTLDRSIPGAGMIRKPDTPINYCTLSESMVNVQRFTHQNNASKGSEVNIVRAYDTEVEQENADQTYIDQRNKYYKYINSDDNKYMGDLTATRMSENEIVIYLTADNWDFTAFTPNKEITIVFEETAKQKKYGKYKWRVAYGYHYIHIESQGYMTSTHRIALKRCATTVASENDDADSDD